MPEARPLNIDMVVPLSDELRNANTVKVMRGFREILEDFIDNLIDNPPAPAVKMGAKERYEWFMAKIVETNQGDVFGIEVEINLLLQEDYADRYMAAYKLLQQGTPFEQAGFPPPIVSPPFSNYLPGLALGFRAWQKRFRDGFRAYGGGQ